MVDEDFSALLGKKGVQEIKSEKRVVLDKSAGHDASEETRRRAAVAEEKKLDPLSNVPEKLLDPLDFLSFQRPGVQNGVFKNLRLGRYPIDAVLDLHRLNIEEARKSLWDFIRECLENDVRSALITHGKGEGRETPALLKSCVAHWLPQMEEVLAFHTAQKQHGSYGATYVLIKKSEKKKLETKLRFDKR